MSEEKLKTTPGITDVEYLFGRQVRRFKVPCPAHLIVVEYAKLPTADVFSSSVRVYEWRPQDSGWKADHAHVEGSELFVCHEGMIEVWLHDGREEALLVLGRGHALFIPPHIWHRVRVQAPGSYMLVHSDVAYDREKHYLEGSGGFEAFITSRTASTT